VSIRPVKHQAQGQGVVEYAGALLMSVILIGGLLISAPNHTTAVYEAITTNFEAWVAHALG
jgi:hypothetical protein